MEKGDSVFIAHTRERFTNHITIVGVFSTFNAAMEELNKIQPRLPNDVSGHTWEYLIDCPGEFAEMNGRLVE